MTSTAPTSTLTIRVLLFASYAELLGREGLELALQEPATVGDALAQLRNLPGGERLPLRPLCALNLTQAAIGDRLSEGDEIAILPPVSGG